MSISDNQVFLALFLIFFIIFIAFNLGIDLYKLIDNFSEYQRQRLAETIVLSRIGLDLYIETKGQKQKLQVHLQPKKRTKQQMQIE
jgi:photosystem I reaction center subunit XII